MYSKRQCPLNGGHVVVDIVGAPAYDSWKAEIEYLKD